MFNKVGHCDLTATRHVVKLCNFKTVSARRGTSYFKFKPVEHTSSYVKDYPPLDRNTSFVRSIQSELNDDFQIQIIFSWPEVIVHARVNQSNMPERCLIGQILIFSIFP